MFQKSFWRPAVLRNLLKVLALLLHQLQRHRLKHLDRLDMYVAVGNQGSLWWSRIVSEFVILNAARDLLLLYTRTALSNSASPPAPPSW
jgi:hypothetical protein